MYSFEYQSVYPYYWANDFGYPLISYPHLPCKSLAADFVASYRGALNVRLDPNKPGDHLHGKEILSGNIVRTPSYRDLLCGFGKAQSGAYYIMQLSEMALKNKEYLGKAQGAFVTPFPHLIWGEVYDTRTKCLNRKSERIPRSLLRG